MENIKACNNFWFCDVYHKQKVKDFKKTNLCRDKFCSNCKKVIQAGRMAKYIPEIEKHKGYVYHLTLTAPRVSGHCLYDRVRYMAKCFRKLYQYVSGQKKIKGLDFSFWNCIGGLRSLEITVDSDFHPHYHCLLLLPGFVMGEKNVVNDYSYSYGKLQNRFSREEIYIQKIWYLLINGEKVTLQNICELQQGYSCKMDKLKEGDYNEIFKYITKEVREDGKVITYENFRVLYQALFRLKQIQGYGVLYSVGDDPDLESIIEQYQIMVDLLREAEEPKESVGYTVSALLHDEKYLLVSRKSYMKYFRDIEG